MTVSPTSQPSEKGQPKSGGSLSLRIITALVVVFLLSLFGAAFLNFTKFEQTYMGLAHERYDTVVRDLRSDLENSLGIGLSLAATQSTQVVTERLVEQYDQQFSVFIISPDGDVLFEAGLESYANHLAKTNVVERAARLEPGTVIRFDADDHLINLTAVHNPFGELEGYIILEYDATQVRSTIDNLAALLTQGVLIVGVVFVSVIAILIYLMIRPIDRGFRRDQQAFDALLVQQPDTQILPEHPVETGYVFADEVNREITSAESELTRREDVA